MGMAHFCWTPESLLCARERCVLWRLLKVTQYLCVQKATEKQYVPFNSVHMWVKWAKSSKRNENILLEDTVRWEQTSSIDRREHRATEPFEPWRSAHKCHWTLFLMCSLGVFLPVESQSVVAPGMSVGPSVHHFHHQQQSFNVSQTMNPTYFSDPRGLILSFLYGYWNIYRMVPHGFE